MATNNDPTFLQWLRQCPPGSLSPLDVAYFIRQAANALQPVHDQKIVHQCVTPASFLLRYNNERPGLPGLQLANFDRTKYSLTSNIRQPIVGATGSMAPEQWQGRVVPATDQYALAVMAYQLLTWQAPFHGNDEQLKYQHQNVLPTAPSTLNPRIPASLNGVILRALAKNPAARYPSVSAFADAFQQAVQLSMAPSSPMPVNFTGAPSAGSPRQLPDTATVSPLPTPNRAPASSPIREVVILATVFLVVVSGIGFGFYSIVKNNQAILAHFNSTTTPTVALSGTPIFADSLSKNTNGRWAEAATCVFKDGTYHVFVRQSGTLEFCGMNKPLTFADAAIQVDVSLLSGSSAGLIFRFNGLGGHHYDYLITNQGEFFLAVNGNDLFPLAKSSAIAPGSQKNSLLVIAKGSDIKLYINRVFVREVQDSSYVSGSFYFGVEADPPLARGEASFSNLKVYSV